MINEMVIVNAINGLHAQIVMMEANRMGVVSNEAYTKFVSEQLGIVLQWADRSVKSNASAEG